jgi:Putative adhesin
MSMKKIFAIIFMSIVAASLSIAWKSSDDASDYQSKSFAVQKGGLLTVDVEPGAVRIESWSKDEVFVEAEGIDERHPDRLVMNQSGNNVTVEYKDKRSHTDHLKFSIKVPSKFNVDVQTTGGSIKQKDVLTGDFKAESGGGSIEIDHIIGKVDVETGGGSIKIEKVEGDVKMQTGGGSIETGLITGIVNAKTGGGSITLREAGGKVNASTGGGSVKVENAKEWIDISTGGGSVRVHGAMYGAKVKTGGGSIEMEDIIGLVDVSTGGGSIKCELTPGSTGNSSIRTGGGEIQLTLPENAKAIVEATINIGNGWGRHHKKCTIHSDFKADTYENKENDDHIYAVYTLNGGGPTITLETSDSDIEIQKMSAQ